MFFGNFKNGNREGEGTLFNKDEKVIYKGNWNKDKPQNYDNNQSLHKTPKIII